MDEKKNKLKIWPTVIITIIALLFLMAPTFVFFVIATMDGEKTFFLVPVIFFLLLALIGFITFSISNKRFYKKTIISLGALTFILFSIFVGESHYKNLYIPSITVAQKNFSSYYYEPFKRSENLAHLDSESTLKFSKDDELPIIDGATALIPIYCSFVEATYPSDCEIEKLVNYNTTKGAYENLIKGDCDIIFVAQPSKKQIEAAKDFNLEFNLHPIGFEAFVFLVNKNNPVDTLSLDEIKKIYTGEITNWKELGGKNQTIRPFQRDENSGSQTAFISIMGSTENLLKPETRKAPSMEGLIDVVADYQNHKNAIGYSFRFYVENMKNKNVKILKLNDVSPTKETIRNKSYPITDNFYAITIKGRESENVTKFIDWIQGAQGQELIEKVGYVSLAGD